MLAGLQRVGSYRAICSSFGLHFSYSMAVGEYTLVPKFEHIGFGRPFIDVALTREASVNEAGTEPWHLKSFSHRKGRL